MSSLRHLPDNSLRDDKSATITQKRSLAQRHVNDKRQSMRDGDTEAQMFDLDATIHHDIDASIAGGGRGYG